MQPRLIDDRHHFPKQNIHMATALFDRSVDSEHPQQTQQYGNEDKTANERGESGNEERNHRFVSCTTCWAWLNSPSRTLRTYAPKVPSPARFNSDSWPARETSGCTSAWAFKVSISAARLESSILWSAAAWAKLMSEETMLWAVLIAASADSTSAGGSMPVISEASSTMP